MKSGFVTKEVHLEKILYNYEFSLKNTINQQPEAQDIVKRKMGKGLECFKDDESIFIAVSPVEVTKHQDTVVCRDKNNDFVDIPRAEFEQYHIYKVPWA